MPHSGWCRPPASFLTTLLDVCLLQAVAKITGKLRDAHVQLEALLAEYEALNAAANATNAQLEEQRLELGAAAGQRLEVGVAARQGLEVGVYKHDNVILHHALYAKLHTPACDSLLRFPLPSSLMSVCFRLLRRPLQAQRCTCAAWGRAV